MIVLSEDEAILDQPVDRLRRGQAMKILLTPFGGYLLLQRPASAGGLARDAYRVQMRIHTS